MQQQGQQIIIWYGIDLGSKDMTAYCKYDGKKFERISKEEYEKLKQNAHSNINVSV